MGTAIGKKTTYHNCLLKAFELSDGSRTTSYRRAIEEMKAGNEVKMFVHVKRYGCWETSSIKLIDSTGRSKTIETQGHFYQMVGNEPALKIKEAKFFVNGENRNLTTSKKEDVEKINQLVNQGCDLKAEVYLRDGSCHVTSKIVDFMPRKKAMISQTYTVYHW